MSFISNPSSASTHPDPGSSAENHEREAVVSQGDTDLTAVPSSGSPSMKAKGVAPTIVATIAVVFALHWAQGLVISMLLGVAIAYTLNPLVVWLEQIRIPRVVGASFVMVAVTCALVFGTYSLRGQMQAILTQLPVAASKLAAKLVNMRNVQNDNMQKIQSAAGDMERATSSGSGNSSSSEQSNTHVVVDAPAFRLGNLLWAGSKGLLGFIAHATMVAFLAYFLLLAGGTVKRKLVRLMGPSLSRRKTTVHILDDITRSIQRYMFMLLVTNVLVGLLAWLVFRWIGLENAGAWAVAAGLLHVIPYIGPGIIAGATGMAAFMQFNTLSTALLVSGTSLAIAMLVGTFIATWMTGRIAKMNTAAIYVSLLFWGWLWGVWGMFLSVPIMVIVKLVSQRVERLQLVSQILGE